MKIFRQLGSIQIHKILLEGPWGTPCLSICIIRLFPLGAVSFDFYVRCYLVCLDITNRECTTSTQTITYQEKLFLYKTGSTQATLVLGNKYTHRVILINCYRLAISPIRSRHYLDGELRILVVGQSGSEPSPTAVYLIKGHLKDNKRLIALLHCLFTAFYCLFIWYKAVGLGSLLHLPYAKFLSLSYSTWCFIFLLLQSVTVKCYSLVIRLIHHVLTLDKISILPTVQMSTFLKTIFVIFF